MRREKVNKSKRDKTVMNILGEYKILTTMQFVCYGIIKDGSCKTIPSITRAAFGRFWGDSVFSYPYCRKKIERYCSALVVLQLVNKNDGLFSIKRG